MGKHTNSRAVDRGGLIRRYATLRELTPERAERVTRQWSRTELRDIVESVESLERPYSGRHARFAKAGRTTAVHGITSTVEGIVR